MKKLKLKYLKDAFTVTESCISYFNTEAAIIHTAHKVGFLVSLSYELNKRNSQGC